MKETIFTRNSNLLDLLDNDTNNPDCVILTSKMVKQLKLTNELGNLYERLSNILSVFLKHSLDETDNIEEAMSYDKEVEIIKNRITEIKDILQ